MKQFLDNSWGIEDLKHAVRDLQRKDEKREMQIFIAVLMGVVLLTIGVIAAICIGKKRMEDDDDWDWEDFDEELYDEDEDCGCDCDCCCDASDIETDVKVEKL